MATESRHQSSVQAPSRIRVRPQAVSTPWPVIALAFLAWAATESLTRVVPAVQTLLNALAEPTGGLVSGMLLGNLLTLGALLAVAVGAGKLRLRDLGLGPKGLLRGAGAAVGLWLIWQLSLLAFRVVAGGGIQFGARWTSGTLAFAIEMLLAMLSVGLVEELWFRGFLLTQLRLKFGRLAGQRWGVVTAVVATSLFFGAVHLWGATDRSVSQVLLYHSSSGLIFALLFLYSGNLWFVAAVHGLGNWGLGHGLFASALNAGTVWMYWKAATVLIWTAVLALRVVRGERKTVEVAAVRR